MAVVRSPNQAEVKTEAQNLNSDTRLGMQSSLSSVVSKLVRASYGQSIPATTPDDEIDREVAKLILKEAKQKEELYNKQGLRAYLPHTGL